MSMSFHADAYAADGFCVHADCVLPADVVTAAQSGLAEVRAGRYDSGRPPRPSPWNPGDSDDVLCKIEMPQMANGAICALVAHSDLGAVVADATGARRVQVWWVQLLHKLVCNLKSLLSLSVHFLILPVKSLHTASKNI